MNMLFSERFSVKRMLKMTNYDPIDDEHLNRIKSLVENSKELPEFMKHTLGGMVSRITVNEDTIVRIRDLTKLDDRILTLPAWAVALIGEIHQLADSTKIQNNY